MPVPAYFTTSPINGGAAITIAAPAVGGIVYDFVGKSGARVTAYLTAKDLPAFTSQSNEIKLLSSGILPPSALNALGGGIEQMAVRLTVNDGDTSPGNFDAGKSFLIFNGVSQAVNLGNVQTITHNGTGDTSSAQQQGYPDGVLATGWGLITDATRLTAIYDSIVAGNGTINVQWQSAVGGGGNALNFQQGLGQSIIDTPSIPPNIVPSIGLNPISDTGISQNDRITFDTTPEISGYGNPGDNLNIYIQPSGGAKTLLGTAIVDASSRWTLITTPPLAEGVYTFTAETVDGSGNATASLGGVNVTIDTTPPAGSVPAITGISLDSGTPGDGITNDRTLVINGTTDPNAIITVLQGGSPIGTVQANSSGQWSLDYTDTTLADGTYNFTAAISDVAGNTASSASAPFAVVIDGTIAPLPTAPILATTSDTGTPNDNITSDDTPTITGTGATPGDTIQVFAQISGGAPVSLGTTVVEPNGSWFVTPSSVLPIGTYSVTAILSDTAGNTSTSPALSVQIVAVPAPSIPDLEAASDKGKLDTDNITSLNIPTFSGTAQANSTVEVFAGTTSLGQVVTNGSGLWTLMVGTPLNDDIYNITATATEPGGKTSPASSPLSITIDTAAPGAPSNLDLTAASDDGTSNTDNITSDNTPSITGSAEPNSSVELFDGTASLGTVTTNGSGDWTFTPSNPLLVGPYSITTKATDAAGNTGAASAPLPLTITAPPGVPFNLNLVDASDTGASNTDNLTQDNTPTVTGKADPNTTVVVFDGTTTLGEAIANASGDWTFTPLSPLADGVYPFSAKQKDGAGNLGTAAAPLNITIDNAAPAAPTTAPNLIDISDTGTSNTDNITGDNTPTFDGTVPLNTAMVELFAGTTSLGKAPVDASGKWSFTPTTALADNTYSVTVKAIDAAGNTSLASPPLSVTIDALPPKVTFTPIQTNDTTPALTGNIDDPNAVVEVKINGVTYLATNKGDGTWFIPDNTIAPLTDGGFDILVTAKDKQGNSATDNGGGDGTGGTTKALTIDGTAPTGAILTIAPTPNGVNTVSIQFTEPVTNFDVSDLQLTRNTSGADEPVSLAGAKLASSDGGKTWALTNIAGITNLTGDYKLTLNRSDIKDLAGNGIVADATSAFSLVDDCVFGIALTVPKIKGRKGTKQNGNSSGNSLRGSNGKDKLRGLNGADYMVGGGGSDRLTGGKGKDRVVGGRGRDRVIGGGGNDKVKGGGGKDMLTGGGGKDMLAGNNGSDILTGGAKEDILKGGKGKDMFVFSGLASEGNDLIKRFQTQQDVIDLRPIFARTEFTGITPDAKFHQYIQTVQVGANTQVKVDLDGAGSGTTFGAIATLRNINASTINCSSFVVA